MRLAYINGHVQIPSKSAASIHMMKMASAYSVIGFDVKLYACNSKTIKDVKDEDIFNFYGVEKKFKIQLLNLYNNKISKYLYHYIIIPILVYLFSPSIVHSRSLATAYILAKYTNLPVLFELHDRPDKNEKMFTMFNYLYNSSNCIGIICITRALSEYLKDKHNINNKILIAPDGVDIINISNDDIINFKDELNISFLNRRLAVYTGHLYEGRGIELIMYLAEHCKSYQFYLIGGHDSDIDRWRIKAANLTNITFVGYKKHAEVYKYQFAADVLLMPYESKVYTEGGENTAQFASPLKMFEYMNAGRPIISSKLDVLNEVLINNHNAFMISYENPSEWAAILDYLLINPQSGEIIGRQAKLDVTKYSWENRAKQITSFIKNTLKG